MNPGILDRELTIKRKVIGSNEYNEEVVSGYENIPVDPVIMAAKNMHIGQEDFMADQLVSSNIVRWIAWYRDDLTAEMVVIEDGIPYEIESIREASGKDFYRREAIEIKTVHRDNLKID